MDSVDSPEESDEDDESLQRNAAEDDYQRRPKSKFRMRNAHHTNETCAHIDSDPRRIWQSVPLVGQGLARLGR